MKWFELDSKDSPEDLRDGLNRRIRRVFVPAEEDLDKLNAEEIRDQHLLRISNVEPLEDDRPWEVARSGEEASYLAMSALMSELVGESEIMPEKEGYSLEKWMELLHGKCFVQCSELSLANVIACLDGGGNAIAYFPEQLWRSFYGEDFQNPLETLGFRTVRITDADADGIVYDDYASKDGRNRRMDNAAFEWLSNGGWMLEVYK